MQGPAQVVEQYTELDLSAVEGYRKEDNIEPDEPYKEVASLHISAEQRGNEEMYNKWLSINCIVLLKASKFLLTCHYERKKAKNEDQADPECSLFGMGEHMHHGVPPNLESLIDEDETGEGYCTGAGIKFIVFKLLNH